MVEKIEDLIDAKRVGEILDWDIQKVYRMAREARIPSRKVGNGFVFVASEIAEHKKKMP